jgi:hypothetical protein
MCAGSRARGEGRINASDDFSLVVPGSATDFANSRGCVRRIAADCTFIDERGTVGIRLEPAAAIVRQYGEQFRAPRRQRRPRLGFLTGFPKPAQSTGYMLQKIWSELTRKITVGRRFGNFFRSVEYLTLLDRFLSDAA